MNSKLKKSASDITEILIQLNLPPIPSQIISYLLINNPEGATSSEIEKDLNVSKGSVSGAVNYLEALELIGFQSRKSSRSRYIYLKPLKIANYLKRRMSFFSKLTESLKVVIDNKEDGNFTSEINQVTKLCSQLDILVNQTIREWEDSINEK